MALWLFYSICQEISTGHSLRGGAAWACVTLYRSHFLRNGAVYLTTVGYGTDALLGRGIWRVKAVHSREQFDLAQAVGADAPSRALRRRGGLPI